MTDAKKLYVSCLSTTTTEEMLEKEFECFGEVVEVKLQIDPKIKVSKGYAYVSFLQEESAKNCIKSMNGTEFDGRKIKVEIASEKQLQPWYSQFRASNARAFEDKPPTLDPRSYTELPFKKANDIKFDTFCTMLDSIKLAKGPKKKLDILFSDQLRTHLLNNSWYPLMRLVLPDCDRERPRYGLKAQAMAKLFAGALTLPKDHPNYLRLVNWKDPNINGESTGGAVGDFPNVLREVLDERGFKETTKGFTVGKINEMLDELHNFSKTDDKEGVLRELLQNCNSREMFWLTRIVLKDMNCGLRYEPVLRRYHKDAIDAMNSHGDLRRCVAELSDPNISRQYSVEIFSTVSPMLAKVIKMDVATEKLSDFVIEPKMDGDRMLVHIDKTRETPKIMMFTRNGTDYTNRYGSPMLFKNFLESFDCDNCIVDGEMLAYDEVEDRVLEFGQTTTVANEMNEPNYDGTKRWLYYVCFDILFLNHSVLTGNPLRSRKQALTTIFRPIERKVEMVKQLVVTETDLEIRHRIVMSELDRMIIQKGEGLILKSLSSPYIPGEAGRKSGHWVKVKPENVHGLQEELDVLILGGYYSEGHRRSSTNALDPSVFLVGVPGGNKKTADGRPAEFFCLAKIGTGYTFAELAEMRRRLRPHFIRTAEPGAPRPTHFTLPVRKGDFPDVWIRPEDSIILQVTGAELVPCDWFSANYTLRFPRCSRIRYDKAWYEATPFHEVERFATDFKSGIGLHGAKKAIDITRAEAGANKRPLNSKRRRAPEVVLGVGSTAHLAAIQSEEDGPLEGYTFYVFPCSDGFIIKNHSEIKTLEEVECYLKEKGGIVNKTPPMNAKERSMILASTKSISHPSQQMKNIFAKSSHDILKVDFIVDCVENDSRITDPKFSDFLFMSDETKKKMKHVLDKYGDHFTENSDLIALERCMQEVKKAQDSKKKTPSRVTKKSRMSTLNDEKNEDEQIYVELLKDEDDPLGIPSNNFRGIFAYFVNLENDLHMKFASAVLRLHGGRIVNTVDSPLLTHVFASKNEPPEIINNIKSSLKNTSALVLDVEYIFTNSHQTTTWELLPFRDFFL